MLGNNSNLLIEPDSSVTVPAPFLSIWSLAPRSISDILSEHVQNCFPNVFFTTQNDGRISETVLFRKISRNSDHKRKNEAGEV